VDDEFWALIEPLLPPWPEKASGPKPEGDRLCQLCWRRPKKTHMCSHCEL
jgi:hypothetical protein